MRLHRSLGFWAGLLVMGFLAWAWRDSRGHDSYVRWRGVSAGNVQNGIAVLSSMPGLSGDLEWRRDSANNVFPGELVPPPFFVRGSSGEAEDSGGAWNTGTLKEFIRGLMRRRPPEAWCLFVPHWLILVGAAGVTGGLLVWRMRRWRKAQEEVVAE